MSRYKYKSEEYPFVCAFLILAIICGIFDKTGLCIFFTFGLVGDGIERAILKAHDKESGL